MAFLSQASLVDSFMRWWVSFQESFYLNFIKADRYMLLVNGLGVTLRVAFFAILLGTLLGFIAAICKMGRIGTSRFQPLQWISSLYITIIRGTPIVVQILIIYFVIFASVDIPKETVAIIAFGFNSGAYVAEIFRAGIQSIDRGQVEAGRSLGLNGFQTMRLIILPQAVKNVLPALGNEFIMLIKETSIAGYIALEDLTKAGDIIRSRTYEALLPLLAVALIYLVIVMILSKGLQLLERRLRVSD